MNSPQPSFDLKDKTLTLTFPNSTNDNRSKTIIISKVETQGFIRNPFNRSQKFSVPGFTSNQESLYNITISQKSGGTILTAEKIPLKTVIEIISDNIDDKDLCILLSNMNAVFVSQNEPRHYTKFKGKKDMICKRKDNKNKFKKFKIGERKFLVVLVNEMNLLGIKTLYRFYEYKSDGDTSLYESLGVYGKWKLLFEDSYVDTRKTGDNLNKFAERQKNQFLQKIVVNFHNYTGIDLNQQQKDKIYNYLNELNDNTTTDLNKQIILGKVNINSKYYETRAGVSNNKNYELLN